MLRPRAPDGLAGIEDDQLAAMAAAALAADVPGTPDVAPAVMERLERDLLAYPEQFARSPAVANGPLDPRRRHGRKRRGLLLAGLALAVAIALVSMLLLASVSGTGAAQQGRVSLTLEPLVVGLDEPVLAIGSGDGSGRLFVVEQSGSVWVVEAAGALVPEPFLDIRERVSHGGERGLLGLAFHPDFASSGRLFVHYTRRPDGASVVSEIGSSGDHADPDSERVLLVVEQPAENHNGGMIAFDRDGHLLIGLGDGGGAGDPYGHAQDGASLLGKLLRIDVDTAAEGSPYGIPEDNGFTGHQRVAPEIHAMGLRNPWRFSVDRVTGDVLIGDVGQGSWEEIDRLPGGRGGLDFGWNQVEGPECFRPGCDPSAHEPPVAWYGHAEGCSVVGGYVYRGTAQPALEGLYLFGDYCSGTIWSVPADGLASGSDEPAVAGALDGPLSSFGHDDAGEILVVDHTGRILRLLVDGV